MKINKVKFKNFYSFKNAELDLTKYKGLVLVEGKNKDNGGSNGAGKSVIFEAIVFGVYGKTIRKSTEEALVNSYAGKGLLVSVEIEKEGVGTVVIERTKRPTTLKLFINSEQVTKSNAAATQKAIDDILGVDYKTFIASTVFGQHTNVEFLDATTDDKRQIIRSYLGLEGLFSVRERIKELKSEFLNGSKVAEGVIKALVEKKDKLEQQIKGINLPPSADQKVEMMMKRYTLSEILSREQKVTELERVLRELKTTRHNQLTEKRELDQFIEKGPFKKITECGECGQSYEKSVSIEEVNAAKKRVKHTENELKLIENEIDMTERQIDKDTPKICSTDYAKLQEIIKLSEKEDLLKKQYLEIADDIATYEATKNFNLRRYEIMKFWEKIFSEQGLVRYIIDNVLSYLNTRINFYLGQLTDGLFSITFNNELKETIHSDNTEVQFISLSGGEKRKMNLAVMLGLQDLMVRAAKDHPNIIFLDEVGENIDEVGILGVYNLLNSLKGEKDTVFVITHNKGLKSLIESNKVIDVVKHNGESRLKE